ncbi:MAG: hypothetical protein HZA14_01865 [Nitrospirae bacterium]|nr:hypothetical protein [Nitrospirota bacterium]
MVKAGGFFIPAVCLFLQLASISAVNAGIREAVWEDVSDGIRERDLQRVAACSENTDLVYASSLHSVYRTADGGKNWDEVFMSAGNKINAVATSPSDANIVFVGTQKGLYESNDGGMKWERIFTGVGEPENSIFSIAVHPVDSGVIFIGAGIGAYFTNDNGKEWRKGRNLPAGSPVTSLAIDTSEPVTIYAAADKGLYKSVNGGSDWQRIFVTTPSEEDSDTSDDETEPDEIAPEARIKSIAVDPSDGKIIYVGTSASLFVTGDGGLTWKEAGKSGLISRDIRHLVGSKDLYSVYAATGRGIFGYSGVSESWEALYKGIASQAVRYLAVIQNHKNHPTLWAATKRGLFKTSFVSRDADAGNRSAETGEVFSMFAHEPSIEEIREAAITYAEVHPDKIAGWRKAAAKKALLPELKVAYDLNRSWQGGSYYYSGKYIDNDITKDKDKAWSISLTWQLGDLIWNDDQTSIDSRSKLMVELRDNVLNEVTRLYFERRKLQVELLLSPPRDIKSKIDKELRLQELTADIDALTGSYLSRRLSAAGK